MRVSFSTIYRWVRLRYLEPGIEARLRRHRKRPKPKIKRFPGAKRVRDRDSEASSRERVGDWELDTIVSSKKDMSGLLTMRERKSRYCVMVYMRNMRNSKSQWSVERAIAEVSAKIPMHTVASDQGVEFLCYKNVEAKYNIPFYVCDPHSPGQKGSVENLKGTNFRNITGDEFQNAMNLLNNRPHKCLGWKTPTEILFDMS